MRSALLVTDLPREEAERYGARAQRLFRALEQYGPVECRVVSGEEFHTVADIMQMIHDFQASMVGLYRSLKTESRNYPYTLGTIVDVITQATDIPVLLLPQNLLMKKAKRYNRPLRQMFRRCRKLFTRLHT